MMGQPPQKPCRLEFFCEMAGYPIMHYTTCCNLQLPLVMGNFETYLISMFTLAKTGLCITIPSSFLYFFHKFMKGYMYFLNERCLFDILA